MIIGRYVMNDKNKNDKIDYKSLNALIQTARVILKILLICGVVIFGFIVLEKTQILNILGTIFTISLPLFIGFGFAWLVEPMIKYFERKKISRKGSTFIVYALLILVLILLIVLVVPEFISQLRELIGQIPAFVADIKNFVTNLLSKFKDSEIDIVTIQNNIFAQLENFASGITNNSISNIVNTITSILSSSATVLLGLIIGVYFSFDFDKIQSRIKSIIPKKHKEEGEKLLHELNVMSRGYVSGTLFTSLVVTFFTFVGLLISGISSPLLFAIFCGITNIVPYFGPYIGGIPTIIVAFSINPMCGVIVLITIVLVQTIEGNIINPIIVGKATDIHPITIIIGLLIFQHYFGIVGMIIATPVIGAIKILFNFFNDKYGLIDMIKTPKEEKKKKNYFGIK
jgi:predicted PurR-regulated permease PerM